MNAKALSTFVTPVDLLQGAIDALEHDPEESQPPDPKHPQDAYADARVALDVVTGDRIASTTRAYANPT